MLQGIGFRNCIRHSYGRYCHCFDPLYGAGSGCRRAFLAGDVIAMNRQKMDGPQFTGLTIPRHARITRNAVETTRGRSLFGLTPGTSDSRKSAAQGNVIVLSSQPSLSSLQMLVGFIGRMSWLSAHPIRKDSNLSVRQDPLAALCSVGLYAAASVPRAAVGAISRDHDVLAYTNPLAFRTKLRRVSRQWIPLLWGWTQQTPQSAGSRPRSASWPTP